MSADDARLFVYINYKIRLYDWDYDKFIDASLEVEAIKFLMNDKELDVCLEMDKYVQVIKGAPGKLKILDNSLRDNFGMEIRIKSELLNRYRLHTEKEFCDKKLKMYRDDILQFIKKKTKK